MPSNVMLGGKRHAVLLQMSFWKIVANLAHIQAENLQMSKKCVLAKISGSQWVKRRTNDPLRFSQTKTVFYTVLLVFTRIVKYSITYMKLTLQMLVIGKFGRFGSLKFDLTEAHSNIGKIRNRFFQVLIILVRKMFLRNPR